MAGQLKELRRRKLLSQKELADAVGVQYQTVQRWEHGARYPRPVHQRRLCTVLGLRPDELLAVLEGAGGGGKIDGLT